MSLYTITFDSSDYGTDTETSFSDSHDESATRSQIELHEDEPPKPIATPEPKNRTRRTVRNLTEDETKTAPKKASGGTEILHIYQEKKVKVNGVRLYFRAVFNGNQVFMAKARAIGSKTIPITRKHDIHTAKRKDYIACVQVENDATDFTLVELGERNRHLLSVQFGAAKTEKEGGRKTYVTFLGDASLPSRLTSIPVKSPMDYEGRVVQRSIKNAILADEEGNVVVMIRKQDKNAISVDAKLHMDQLWLFGIGIAAFMGKKPKR